MTPEEILLNRAAQEASLPEQGLLSRVGESTIGKGLLGGGEFLLDSIMSGINNPYKQDQIARNKMIRDEEMRLKTAQFNRGVMGSAPTQGPYDAITQELTGTNELRQVGGQGLLGGGMDEMGYLMKMQSSPNMAMRTAAAAAIRDRLAPSKSQAKYVKIVQGADGYMYGITPDGRTEKLPGDVVPQPERSPLVENYIGGKGQVKPIMAGPNDPYGFPEGTPYYFKENGEPKEVAMKGKTEAQWKANTYSIRQDNASIDLGLLDEEGFDPSNIGETLSRLSMEYGGDVGNKMVGEQYQRYYQAMNSWGMANLRDESGAVLEKNELDQKLKNFFTQPGDSTKVQEQKRRARAQEEISMREKAGIKNYKGKPNDMTWKQWRRLLDYKLEEAK